MAAALKTELNYLFIKTIYSKGNSTKYKMIYHELTFLEFRKNLAHNC